MSTSEIPNPSSGSPAPVMNSDPLYQNVSFIMRSTPSLADTEAWSFPFGMDRGPSVNGLYLAKVQGATDSFCFFTVTGGNTVTIALDSSSNFTNTNSTDNKVNIDISSGNIRVENQLGSAAIVELSKLAV